MSSIIVTGGSGRLGRSVVRALAEAGHSVTSIDRSPTPGLPAAQVMVDLTDSEATRAAFLQIGSDAVIQLAAIATPFSAPEQQILTTNIAIAWNVIDAAALSGVTQVLVASSPTVIGYGAPTGWRPDYFPLDEQHPTRPWNAYALSKLAIERMIDTVIARDGDAVVLGAFRPCFVISPEEWEGAPTQQGHTVLERIDDPESSAVALFNYVDARDAADFVVTWIDRSHDVPNGSIFFVGADDALTREPLSELLPRFVPGTEVLAAALTDSTPAFTSAKATRLLGWRPTRSWRTQLRVSERETENGL